MDAQCHPCGTEIHKFDQNFNFMDFHAHYHSCGNLAMPELICRLLFDVKISLICASYQEEKFEILPHFQIQHLYWRRLVQQAIYPTSSKPFLNPTGLMAVKLSQSCPFKKLDRRTNTKQRTCLLPPRRDAQSKHHHARYNDRGGLYHFIYASPVFFGFARQFRHIFQVSLQCERQATTGHS